MSCSATTTNAGMLRTLSLWLLLLVWQGADVAAHTNSQVTIGVLAKRGVPITLQRWSPTIDYLNQALPEYQFSILPLAFEEIQPKLETQGVDFLLANSAIYIQSEHDYHIFRIATLINRSIDHPLDRFGGVIFTRADNTELKRLQDLKARKLAAVDANSFGGYLMAKRELEESAIDTTTDITVLFQGTHDAVVHAVLQGEADAGTVRTDTLERMAEAGLIKLEQIRLLNPMPMDDFPFLLSTRLYPEWPMAALSHVSNDLVKAVSHALLNMPTDHPAAQASKTFGWTVPANYQPVHDLFLALNLPPHRQPPPKLSDWIRQHSLLTEIFIALLLLLIISFLRLFKLNRRLVKSQQHLAESLTAQERITDKLQANMTKLKESEEKFSGLAVSALDAIIMLDPQGHVSFWNRAAQRIFGYTSGQAIGLKIDQWLSSSDEHQSAVKMLSRYIGNHDRTPPGTTLQVEALRRNDEPFSAEIAISSVRISEGWHVICVLRDITDRLQMESDRRRLETELSQRHKMEALAQLSDGIAHEINTPMQAINNNLRFLQESFEDFCGFIATQKALIEEIRPVSNLSHTTESFDKALQELDPEYLTDEVTQAVNQSLDSAEQVKRIVRSLRVFASADTPEKQRTDLNKLIQDLLAISRKLWSTSAELELDLQAPELEVDAYPGELSQALLNLIINATQAIEERHDKDLGLIEISARPRDGQAVIEVRDNGIGIPPEARDHIFNPFFSTREQGKGSGQGLTLTHDVIVRRHDGAVSFHSDPQQGTVFTVSLPLNNKV
jgi:two-component system sensor histidine kinase TtrS